MEEKVKRKRVKELKEGITDQEFFRSDGYKKMLLKLAKVLSGDYQIRVQLFENAEENAPTAFTNGKDIVLNTENVISRMCADREEKIQANEGMIGHECGHVRYSDFNRRTVYVDGFKRGRIYPGPPGFHRKKDLRAWKEMIELINRKDPVAVSLIQHIAAHLNNVLEDVYIEAKMCQKYPGSVKEALQENARKIMNIIPTYDECLKEGRGELNIMMDVLLFYARSGEVPRDKSYPAQFFNYLKPCKNVIARAVTEDDLDIRFHAANILMVKLWKLIRKAIQEKKERKKEQPEVPEALQKEQWEEEIKKNFPFISLSQDSCREGTAELQVAEWGDGTETKETKNLCAQSDPEHTHADKKLQELFSSAGTEQKESEQLDADMEKEIGFILKEIAVDKFIKEQEGQLEEELKQAVPQIESNKEYSGYRLRLVRNTDIPDYFIKSYQNHEPEIKRLSGCFQREMIEALEKRQGGRETGLHMGRRLTVSRLYRLDQRIFEKRTVPEENWDVVFAVLLDISGSMRYDGRLEAEKLAALVLYDFCRSLRIPLMVYAHSVLLTDICFIHSCAEPESEDNRDGYRIEMLSAKGCNLDGMAVRYVGERISRRPEKQKIFMIISDGEPSAPGYAGETATTDLQSAKRELERKGVKVFAAAIGDDRDRIQEIYGNSFLNISDLNRFPRKLVQLLQNYLD